MSAGALARALINRFAKGTGTQVQPALDRYPWTCSVQFVEQPKTGERGYHCGTGVLIAPTIAVTAAHVVSATRDTPIFEADRQVRIGSLDRSEGGEVIAVEKVEEHPDWQGDPITGVDLAVLHLARPSATLPVPLATKRGSYKDQRLVVGWGTFTGRKPKPADNSENFRFLQQQSTFWMPLSAYARYGGELIMPDRLCIAANRQMRYGASGGPVLRSTNDGWLLEGVITRGAHNEKLDILPCLAVCVADHYDWLQSR